MFDTSTNYILTLTGENSKELLNVEVTPIVLKEVDDLFQSDSRKVVKIKDLRNKSHSFEMKLVTHLMYAKVGDENFVIPTKTEDSESTVEDRATKPNALVDEFAKKLEDLYQPALEEGNQLSFEVDEESLEEV